MNLSLFLHPVDEHLFDEIDDPHSFFEHIHLHKHEDGPQLEGMDIALIGLSENRGTLENEGVAFAANAIRKKLYRLKKGYGRYRIIDLGNLKNGSDVEDTYARIRELVEYLLNMNVLPVLFGGSHDLDIGQFRAYETMNKLVTMLNVDAFLDIDFDESKGKSFGHLNEIMMHQPNFLMHYTQLGHQSYLASRESLDVMEKLFFDMIRLGQMRQNITEMEPYIRDADFMSFDISAIRGSDAGGNVHAQPFGLTGEEACQICWYAGLNDKLSSAGFYEYNPDLDTTQGQTASIVATMIWYFVEGYYHRRNEADFRSSDYIKYLVDMHPREQPLVFYKSKFTDKWWMEVPNGLRNPYPPSSMVPCSISDYETACQGQIPERYLQNSAKMF
jgi:formiminoglutamase